MKVSQEYAESIRRPLSSRMKNYTGQQKGRLLLLWPTTVRNNAGLKWAAKCSCGKYAIVHPSSSDVNSCGCVRAEKTKARVAARRPLTREQVIAIRIDKRKPKVIAYDMGLKVSAVYRIRSGRMYADVQ